MLAYATGDAAAFDALYARHKGGVYRYVLRHCGHAGVTDELFQDVWMNVVRARTSYAPSAKFTTWLYRIAHNRLIDHWRATGHVELVTAGADDDDDDPLDAIAGARNDEPEVRAGAREISARLHAALVDAAAGAARGVPAAPGRRPRAVGDRRSHRRRHRDREEPVALRAREAAHRARRPAMTMPRRDDPSALRDPRIDAAWRAASREEPSAALDAAILAAARREVGAGPRSTREPEVTRARRWWLPLAVAATLGAITVGLLQTVTPDRLGAPASNSAVVTDMPTPIATPLSETSTPTMKAAPEAAAPIPTPAPGAATVPGPATTPSADKIVSDGYPAPRANSAPRAATAGRAATTERALPRTDMPRSPETPLATPAEQKQESAARASPALPEPFPGAQPHPSAAADVSSSPAPATAGGGGIAPPAASSESLSPKTATRDPTTERAPVARDAAAPTQSFAGRASPPPAAAFPGAQSFQESGAARPSPLAKTAPGSSADGRTEEARIKDRAPLPVPEWIALIRRLRAEGNTADAARELAAFRVAHARSRQTAAARSA